MSESVRHRPVVLLTLGALLAVSLLVAAPVAAQDTFEVNTTADVADPDPADCEDDVDDRCSLRAAVMAANDAPGSAIVLPEAATYELTIAGANEDDAETGDLDVHADTTVTGQGAGETSIDASGLEPEGEDPEGAPDRIFHVNGNHTLSLEGVTLTDGHVEGAGGGAILLEGQIDKTDLDAGATLATDDVEILNSHADFVGGGIGVDGHGVSTVDLSATRIAGNEANDGGGIGVSTGGVVIVDLDGVTVGGTEIDEIPDDDNGLSLPDDANVASSGGGIYVNTGDGAQVSATDSAIDGNMATNAGGGLWLSVGGGEPTLDVTGSSLSGNVAIFGGGGALVQVPWPYDNFVPPIQTQLTDADVNRNLTEREGGGLVQHTGELTVEASRVVANEVAEPTEGIAAGGLTVFGGDLSLAGSELRDNVGQGAGGGYVAGQAANAFDDFAGDVEVVDSTIDGNVDVAPFAVVGGGGLGLELRQAPEAGGYDLEVDGTTFSDNEAPRGGGLSVEGYATSVVNSTVSGNTADSGGGLAVQLGLDEHVDLHHVTFADNALAEPGEVGAAVHVDGAAEGGAVSLSSTIVADSGNGPNCFASQSMQLVSDGHNVDDDGSCVGDPPAVDGDQLVGDAGLEPLADNGGPTLTHALAGDSPALDAADPDACPDTDQRGVDRPQGAGCDVGAFELQPEADLAVDKTVADDEIALGEPTTFTVTVANDGPQTATATTAVDTLPDGVSLDEVTVSPGTCTVDEATVTCELGDLAAGDEATITLAVTGTQPGEQTNVVEATSPVTDPDPERASAQATVTVVDDPSQVIRLGGADRIATAVEVSQDSYPDGGVDTVVLARSTLFPDALAGTPLAVDRDAPLLLTPPWDLDGRTEAEIQRLMPEGGTVVLLGGEEAIEPQVASELEGLGHDTDRFGGAHRFETARIIAEDGLGSPDTTFLATGLDPADALTAGAVAGIVDGAVVLTAGEDMPADTQAYLDANPDATRYAAGGPASAADPDADEAFVGATRFETAIELAEAFVPAPEVVGVATAFEFPDALTGGAHVSRQGGPMVLSDTGDLAGPTEAYLEAHADTIALAYLYGGTAALSADVETATGAAIAGP